MEYCDDALVEEVEIAVDRGDALEGPSNSTIAVRAKKVVFGMIRRAAVYGTKLYNSDVLVGPEGYIGKYDSAPTYG